MGRDVTTLVPILKSEGMRKFRVFSGSSSPRIGRGWGGGMPGRGTKKGRTRHGIVKVDTVARVEMDAERFHGTWK